jgi:hypothetical protein
MAVEDDLALQEMRQTFRWIDHIDRDCTMIRRCVVGRAMVDGRGVHLNSWCRLGRLLRADVRAVRRWHAEGLLVIVSSLTGTARACSPTCEQVAPCLGRGVV